MFQNSWHRWQNELQKNNRCQRSIWLGDICFHWNHQFDGFGQILSLPMEWCFCFLGLSECFVKMFFLCGVDHIDTSSYHVTKHILVGTWMGLVQCNRSKEPISMVFLWGKNIVVHSFSLVNRTVYLAKLYYFHQPAFPGNKAIWRS